MKPEFKFKPGDRVFFKEAHNLIATILYCYNTPEWGKVCRIRLDKNGTENEPFCEYRLELLPEPNDILKGML